MTDNIPFEKSFASHEKAKYWSNKNKISATQIYKCSGKKFWFTCNECNHDFTSILSNIIKGQWCPYCSISSKKLCEDDKCQMCFEKSFASHEKAKYWSNKNKLISRQIFKVSHKQYWFDCDKCNHTFQTTPQIINMGCWCNFCSNRNLCEDVNCKICFDKSFASNEKSKYWSNKNELTARQVVKNSNKKYWFDCDKCNHSFSSILSNINKNDGPRWCPYCSTPCKKLCNDTKCTYCYNNSFASHEKSKYWSNKNELTARQVLKGSHQKFWFNCDKCKHEFDISITNIIGNNWCRFCANQDFCLENCEDCYNKSMASHEKSKYWSNKNVENPRQITKGSRKKIIFYCNICNLDFETIPYSVVFLNSWCPFCNNKTEGKLYKQLLELFPSTIYQFKQDWCKKTNYLPYDFCITDYKIIIELDGPQHFEQIMNWNSPEEQLKVDKFKEKCANENGYSIIRILQIDVLNDKYDWKTELINNIENIKKDNIIQNIYMCKNNEYESFN